MSEQTTGLSADDVAIYLADNPSFLSGRTELLAQLTLATDLEGTISLTQFQQKKSREKNQQLQQQLDLLLQRGEINSDLQARVHELCLTLMDAENLENIVPILSQQLRIEFSADEMALHLFYRGDTPTSLPSLAENVQQYPAGVVGFEALHDVISSEKPLCGRLTQAQNSLLFGEKAIQVKSAGCVSLGKNGRGFLAIGSYDENRFHAEMGTIYLSFLGDVLARLLRADAD